MLIGTRLEPQIFIGVEPSLAQSADVHPLKMLSFFKQELQPHLPHYTLDLFVLNAPEPSPVILNAHLNFQPVSYQDGVISYPFLLSKISSELNRVKQMIQQDPSLAQQHPYNELNTMASVERYNRYNNARNKYRLIKDLTPPHQLSMMNYGEQIQYKLMNLKSETLLLTSDAIDISTFKAALGTLHRIEAQCDQLARQNLNPAHIRKSPYGLAQIKVVTEDTLAQQPSLQALIQQEIHTLSQMDAENLIVDIPETVTQHCLRSFNQAMLYYAQEHLDAQEG